MEWEDDVYGVAFHKEEDGTEYDTTDVVIMSRSWMSQHQIISATMSVTI